MIIKSYAERLDQLPYEQRVVVISARELVGIVSSHSILEQYEQKNARDEIQSLIKRD